MIKRALILCCLLVLVVANTSDANDLKGFSDVSVSIADLVDDLKKTVLSQTKLKTDVELLLRRHDVQLSDDTSTNSGALFPAHRHRFRRDGRCGGGRGRDSG